MMIIPIYTIMLVHRDMSALEELFPVYIQIIDRIQVISAEWDSLAKKHSTLR